LLLDVFLLHCLLADSPPDTPQEIWPIARRLAQAPTSTTRWPAARGREPGLRCVLRQKAIEASDSLPFEQYRQLYVSAERLGRTRPREAA
jgi:hypothetical protein